MGLNATCKTKAFKYTSPVLGTSKSIVSAVAPNDNGTRAFEPLTLPWLSRAVSALSTDSAQSHGDGGHADRLRLDTEHVSSQNHHDHLQSSCTPQARPILTRSSAYNQSIKSIQTSPVNCLPTYNDEPEEPPASADTAVSPYLSAFSSRRSKSQSSFSTPDFGHLQRNGRSDCSSSCDAPSGNVGTPSPTTRLRMFSLGKGAHEESKRASLNAHSFEAFADLFDLMVTDQGMVHRSTMLTVLVATLDETSSTLAQLAFMQRAKELLLWCGANELDFTDLRSVFTAAQDFTQFETENEQWSCMRVLKRLVMRAKATPFINPLPDQVLSPPPVTLTFGDNTIPLLEKPTNIPQ